MDCNADDADAAADEVECWERVERVGPGREADDSDEQCAQQETGAKRLGGRHGEGLRLRTMFEPGGEG